MTRQVDYNKKWSKKAKRGNAKKLGKFVAGSALLAGAAAADVAKNNRKNESHNNDGGFNGEMWGSLFMIIVGIALTIVFFATELSFLAYILLLSINFLFFALVNYIIRQNRRDKEEEARKERYAAEQAEVQAIKELEKNIRPVKENVEQLLLNSHPFEEIDNAIGAFSDREREQILKESYLHVLSHFVDDVEISVEYRDYLNSFEDKYISPAVNISQFPVYWKYQKNLVLSSLLRGELPQRATISGCPINFELGEEIIWVFNSVTMYQEVTKKTSAGASQGLSIRVANGIYYRVGAFRGEPIVTNSINPLFYGDLIITNMNVYFYSTQKSIKYPYSKIISYVPFEDAIGIQPNRANAKTLYFKGVDGRFAFNVLTNIRNIL